MWFYSMRLHCSIYLCSNIVEYIKVTVEFFKMKLPPMQGRIRDLSETVELYQVYSMLLSLMGHDCSRNCINGVSKASEFNKI